MPSIRKVHMGPVVFDAFYFDELREVNGQVGLPQDIEAHALWYYNMLASNALKGAQDNLVYEDDLSRRFDVGIARRLLERISFQYGTTPDRMVRYWEAVDRTRRAMKFSANADLPPQYRFRFN